MWPDLAPAFFLGAYVRLARLGGLGLFVLGTGAAFQVPAYGLSQAAAGLILFLSHLWWERRLPPTGFDPFLRRAYRTAGALAFLAGVAVFAPLALARLASGGNAMGEAAVAVLSLLLVLVFASRLAAESRKPK